MGWLVRIRDWALRRTRPKTLGQRGEAAAHRLYATVLGTVGAASLLATALLWWFADPLVAFQFRAFEASDQLLTALLQNGHRWFSMTAFGRPVVPEV